MVETRGLLGLPAQAPQRLVEPALGLAPLLLAVVDIRHGDDGGQVAGVELEGLVEPRLRLAQQLGVVAQNPRHVGQHHGFGGGALGGRQLALVELRRLVDASLRASSEARAPSASGLDGCRLTARSKHTRACETVRELVAEHRGRLQQDPGLLGLAGHGVRLAQERRRVGLEVVALQVEARQRGQCPLQVRGDGQRRFDGIEGALRIVEIVGLELCLFQVEGRDERGIAVRGA